MALLIPLVSKSEMIFMPTAIAYLYLDRGSLIRLVV
jgi:hypothetical protein